MPGNNLNEAVLASRVLVVDDAAVNRELIREYLAIGGFTKCLEAADGMEALKLIAELKPDIVILDISMPGMDGYEVCRRIRADETDKIPILIQSAMTSASDRTKAFAAGATDFISKPILRGEMIARIRLHLENRLALRGLRDYRERVAAELDLARAMQRSLLPSDIERADFAKSLGLMIESRFETSSELGGDLWGARRLDGHRVAIYTADFSGHGVTAALNCFRLHTMLTMLGDRAAHPGEVLEELNARLHSLLPRGQFLALLYAVIDTSEETVRWAGGACTAPILIRASEGDARFLETAGLPLGARADTRYETQEASFMPGDALFFYSDALVETADDEGALLSEDSLLAGCADRRRDVPSTALIDRILAEFNATRFKNLKDDLTAITIRRSSTQSAPLATLT